MALKLNFHLGEEYHQFSVDFYFYWEFNKEFDMIRVRPLRMFITKANCLYSLILLNMHLLLQDLIFLIHAKVEGRELARKRLKKSEKYYQELEEESLILEKLITFCN